MARVRFLDQVPVGAYTVEGEGNAISASYAFNSTSASYALTASYAMNGGTGGGTPGGSNTQIQYNSGSAFGGVPILIYSASIVYASDIRATGSFSGSLTGTASFATSASYALSSSQTQNATSASYALTASYILNAISSSYASNSLSSSYALSSSHSVSSSQAQSASYYQETDPIFVEKSASLATTGSNTFTGPQIITNVDEPGSFVSMSFNEILMDGGDTSSRIEPNTIITKKILSESNITASITYGSSNIIAEITDFNQATVAYTVISFSQSIQDLNNLVENNITFQDSSGEVAFLSDITSSYLPIAGGTLSGSLIVSGSVTSTDGFTGSLFGTASFATTASYSDTSSYSVSSSYSLSSSYAISSSYSNTSTSASYALNSTSASYASSSTSASYALSASQTLTASYLNNLNQNLNISGNLNITGNLNVIGTASFVYTTQSIVVVGASTILLNTDNPAVRFGGINVIDSGSFGNSSTGSLLWDSQNNKWIYSNPSGSSYDSGMLISGPRNFSGIGNEVGLNEFFVAVSQGSDHITSSQIYTSGSITQITGSLFVTNGITGSFTGSLVGSASYASQSLSASYALSSSYASGSTSASYAFSSTSASYAFISTSSSYASSSTSASYALNSTSASYASNSTSASYAFNSTSASYAFNSTSASYSLNSTSASYASSSTSASYAFNSTTASYALTSAGGGGGGTAYQVGPTSVGNTEIVSYTTGSNRSAFSNYVIYSGSNSRAGQFITVWNGVTASYTDVSTLDIGDTSTIIFTSSISTNLLKITTNTPISWSISMSVIFV